MTEKTLTFEQLGIAAADVYLQMGYPVQGDSHPTVGDAATQEETLAVLDEVRPWLCARFCFFVTRELPEALKVGRIIGKQLSGSEAFACFIATAGTTYHDYLQRLKEQGDLVRLYIADALGSVIAEKCADQMERSLQESIDKLGWHHTNRFSPGYCQWDVAQQHVLFPLFEGHTCGVTLTTSALMVPIKSVSGIIGVGQKVSRRDYVCALCNMKNCFKRRL